MGSRGLTRRDLIRDAGAAAAVGALGGPLLLSDGMAIGARRAQPARGARFSQGVASGDPSPSGLTFWTKLDPLERPATLELEVARDADFRRVVERRTVTAAPGDDHAVNERVGGLDPGEEYWYRFSTRDRDSEVGRSRTALPADSRQPVRIGFFSCQQFDAGFYTPHAGLAAEEDLDLVVALGDYIYERSFTSEPARPDATGANGDGEVQTLAEYRDKYALYHSDANLRAMRAAHPLVAIWDDHEAEDNFARDVPGEATLDPRVPFKKRRANGFRAFFEHMPMRRLRDHRQRLYRQLRLGRSAEVLLLDTRRYRDDQPCGDDDPCADDIRYAPGRTLLGTRQKAWLKDRLEGCDAAWKVLGNQIVAMTIEIPGIIQPGTDDWDGYAAERGELLSFIADRGVEDVVFITGDVHTFYAGEVTPSGRSTTSEPHDVPAATEFVGGSITSGPFGSDDVTAALGEGLGIPFYNPHVRYSNLQRKGYGVLEAREDGLSVEFRAVETVRVPESPAFTLKRFAVARGDPRVQLV